MKVKKAMTVTLASILLVLMLVLNSALPEKNLQNAFSSIFGFSENALSQRHLLTSGKIPKYAHGIQVNQDGEYVFSYDGKTYLNEYERLIAEDGLMFGVDWDWFGGYANGGTVLGDDHINGNETKYDAEYVERSLYTMKALGINCVNVWIGPASCFVYDEEANVAGLDPKFQTNIVKLLDSFRRVGIDLLPTICTHGIGGLNVDKIVNGLDNSDREVMYQRFYYDESVRKAFIENGIRPMLQYLKEYQDIIPVISLGTEQGMALNDLDFDMTYATGYWTYEDYATHLNLLSREVKSVMPNMYVSVEDGGREDLYPKYNDLEIDLFGNNKYRANSQSLNTVDNYMLTKPCYISEFNSGFSYDQMNQYSEQYRDLFRSVMYEDVYKKGYMGLFFFMWTENPAGTMSMFTNGASCDDYPALRNFVVPMSYNIIDVTNDFHGITDALDQPALLYNNDSKINYWRGSRGADSYTLERREIGGAWSVIATGINSDTNMAENGLFFYTDETMELGKFYEYRVISVFPDGKTVASDVGNKCELFNPPEMFVNAAGDYVGGFENLSVNGDKDAFNSNGWYRVVGGTDIGVEVQDAANAYAGTSYLLTDSTQGKGTAGYNTSWWQYNLQLKPNTKYVLEFYAKQVEGVTDIMVRDHVVVDHHGQWVAVAGDEEDPEKWHRNFLNFATPDDGVIHILIKSGNSETRKCILDSFSVKERR